MPASPIGSFLTTVPSRFAPTDPSLPFAAPTPSATPTPAPLAQRGDRIAAAAAHAQPTLLEASRIRQTAKTTSMRRAALVDALLAHVPQGDRGAAKIAIPAILDAARKSGSSDPNRIGYLLATAQTESDFGAHMTETGHPRAWFNSEYGCTDGNRPGTSDGYAFRGRGYVQTTHAGRYAELSRRLGLPDVPAVENGKPVREPALVANPDRLAEPKLAAEALVVGVEKNLFTHNRSTRPFRPAKSPAMSTSITRAASSTESLPTRPKRSRDTLRRTRRFSTVFVIRCSERRRKNERVQRPDVRLFMRRTRRVLAAGGIGRGADPDTPALCIDPGRAARERCSGAVASASSARDRADSLRCGHRRRTRRLLRRLLAAGVVRRRLVLRVLSRRGLTADSTGGCARAAFAAHSLARRNARGLRAGRLLRRRLHGSITDLCAPRRELRTRCARRTRKSGRPRGRLRGPRTLSLTRCKVAGQQHRAIFRAPLTPAQNR
jgi:hypothetical protein